MLKKLSMEMKVGLFALLCIVVISVLTLKFSDRSIVAGGSYEVAVEMDNAIGIKTKTPVEIAGIQVGVVKKIKLDDSRRAKVRLLISKNVRLTEGTKAYVRVKGFLGNTFVSLVPGPSQNTLLPEDSTVPYGGVQGDVNTLMSQFNDIATDVKGVTDGLKSMIGPDESSPVFRTVQNLDTFTESLKEITLRNEENLNRVINNLAILTDELRQSVQHGAVNDTMANLSDITGKVNRGEGTVGKLVNDEETVNKINEAVDNLNSSLGGLRKLETEIGFHTEYLGKSNDFKNYVHLNLKPAPDKALRLEVVSDPAANPSNTVRSTTINAGGASTTVNTDTATVDRQKLLFSAQIAKRFYDFTIRGGVIESTGGLGLDYSLGPMDLAFSAYNFDTKYGRKPHLKFASNLNVTKSLYITGGADDMINPQQPTDWFIGAGIRLMDDDVKTLLGSGAKLFR